MKGVYEPGKRRWLKVKKDYLSDGSMADSADLIVLGAYWEYQNWLKCAKNQLHFICIHLAKNMRTGLNSRRKALSSSFY